MGLNMHNKAARDALRRDVRHQRNAMSSAEQAQFAHQAVQQLLPVITQGDFQRVAVYLTNDGELDTQPLINALWQHNIDVYLPRLHPFSRGNLIFLAYTPETTLTTNKLKIKEPKLDITQMLLPHQLDMIVTPLVAFDAHGARMGMGGGYYDRTLANWQQQGKPLPVGYAHNCQQVDALSQAHWDVPLPMIVTPKQIFDFSQ